MSLYEILNELITARKYTKIEEKDNYMIAENENGVKIYILCEVIPNFKIDVFKKSISTLNSLNIKWGIFVYEKITPSTKQETKKSSYIDYKLEIFNRFDLVINPTKHVLVPEHIKVTGEELVDLKKKIQIKDLPKIRLDDPVVKFLGFERGQVIRIVYPTIPAYRLVV